MAKITSKLQVTIPQVIATRFGLAPGDEVAFVEAGDSIRLIPASARLEPPDVDARLRVFDQATRRQAQRDRQKPRRPRHAARGRWLSPERLTCLSWQRAELPFLPPRPHVMEMPLSLPLPTYPTRRTRGPSRATISPAALETKN